MPDDKNPVEQVLDLFVFAPLGLVMTARNQLPQMVAKGRAQVEDQLTTARFIGKFAVKQGKVELEKRLRTPVAPPNPDPAPPPATATVTLTVADEPAPAPADGSIDESEGSGTAAGDLAIPGYDALSASQVVQRLAGLSAVELEQVRRYEGATRGRKTVLTKISQLQ